MAFDIEFLTEEMIQPKKTGNKVSCEDLHKPIGKPRSVWHLKQSVDWIDRIREARLGLKDDDESLR
jgi:hypothetical protein